jgi:hypothetical protein
MLRYSRKSHLGSKRQFAARPTNVSSWHIADLHFAASEGPITSGLPNLDAECLVSDEKPTMFLRALKVVL